VFVGLGESWLAEPDSQPTADDIATHLSEVSATDPFAVPGSIFEEVFAVCDRLGERVLILLWSCWESNPHQKWLCTAETWNPTTRNDAK
jgi:hypothetical protein